MQSLELRHKAEKDLSSADLIEAALIAINNFANSEENQCHLKVSYLYCDYFGGVVNVMITLVVITDHVKNDEVMMMMMMMMIAIVT